MYLHATEIPHNATGMLQKYCRMYLHDTEIPQNTTGMTKIINQLAKKHMHSRMNHATDLRMSAESRNLVSETRRKIVRYNL